METRQIDLETARNTLLANLKEANWVIEAQEFVFFLTQDYFNGQTYLNSDEFNKMVSAANRDQAEKAFIKRTLFTDLPDDLFQQIYPRLLSMLGFLTQMINAANHQHLQDSLAQDPLKIEDMLHNRVQANFNIRITKENDKWEFNIEISDMSLRLKPKHFLEMIDVTEETNERKNPGSTYQLAINENLPILGILNASFIVDDSAQQLKLHSLSANTGLLVAMVRDEKLDLIAEITQSNQQLDDEALAKIPSLLSVCAKYKKHLQAVIVNELPSQKPLKQAITLSKQMHFVMTKEDLALASEKSAPENEKMKQLLKNKPELQPAIEKLAIIVKLEDSLNEENMAPRLRIVAVQKTLTENFSTLEKLRAKGLLGFIQAIGQALKLFQSQGKQTVDQLKRHGLHASKETQPESLAPKPEKKHGR